MRKHVFAMLTVVFVFFGLYRVVAFAQVEPEKKEEKPKAKHKRSFPVASCSFNSKGMILRGAFKEDGNNDQFSRTGFFLGMGCQIHKRSPFSVGLGWGFYMGNFNLDHEEGLLRGNFSYLEIGLKQWLRFGLDLKVVNIGLELGVQQTNSSSFQVNNFELKFDGEDNGSLNLTDFAKAHLISSGELEVWDLGLDSSFPIGKKLSLTFGLLWQRWLISARIGLDHEALKTLEVLNVATDTVEQDFHRTVHFFYFTPGIKWCQAGLCAALTVPWATFNTERWSWGTSLELKYRF